jgi:hypothetical protein
MKEMLEILGNKIKTPFIEQIIFDVAQMGFALK